MDDNSITNSNNDNNNVKTPKNSNNDNNNDKNEEEKDECFLNDLRRASVPYYRLHNRTPVSSPPHHTSTSPPLLIRTTIPSSKTSSISPLPHTTTSQKYTNTPLLYTNIPPPTSISTPNNPCIVSTCFTNLPSSVSSPSAKSIPLSLHKPATTPMCYHSLSTIPTSTPPIIPPSSHHSTRPLSFYLPLSYNTNPNNNTSTAKSIEHLDKENHYLKQPQPLQHNGKKHSNMICSNPIIDFVGKRYNNYNDNSNNNSNDNNNSNNNSNDNNNSDNNDENCRKNNNKYSRRQQLSTDKRNDNNQSNAKDISDDRVSVNNDETATTLVYLGNSPIKHNNNNQQQQNNKLNEKSNVESAEKNDLNNNINTSDNNNNNTGVFNETHCNEEDKGLLSNNDNLHSNTNPSTLERQRDGETAKSKWNKLKNTIRITQALSTHHQTRRVCHLACGVTVSL